MTLESTTPASAANLIVTGTQNFGRLIVTDIDATGSTSRLIAHDSNTLSDGGGNTFWSFYELSIASVFFEVESNIVFRPFIKSVSFQIDETVLFGPMFDTCVIEIKTLPPVADAKIEALLTILPSFLNEMTQIPANDKALNVIKKYEVFTNASGIAFLTLPTEFNKLSSISGFGWVVRSPQLNLDTLIVVPDQATAKFADTVVTT